MKSSITTKPMSTSKTKRPGNSGFSLIELLVVISIMAVLAYSASSVSISLQESNNISSAGQTVVDELAVARAYAASHNQSVYVRFITPAGSAYKGYNAIQLFRPDPLNPGNYLEVDQAIRLPSQIEISANPTISPLVSTLVVGSAGAMASDCNVPGAYVSFIVRPDGKVVVAVPPSTADSSTSALQSMPYYFLTVLPVRYDGNATVPTNYVTIQVNPDTGVPQKFEP